MMFSSRGEKFRFAEFPRLGPCRYQWRIQYLTFSLKLLYISVIFWHAEIITVFTVV